MFDLVRCVMHALRSIALPGLEDITLSYATTKAFAGRRFGVVLLKPLVEIDVIVSIAKSE